MQLVRARGVVWSSVLSLVAGCLSIEDSPTAPLRLSAAHVASASAVHAPGAAPSGNPLLQKMIASFGAIGAAPVAQFSASCKGPFCTFDATGSADVADLVTFAWSFGNGAPQIKRTPVLRATLAPGIYPVALTVTVGGTLTSNITQQIVVSPEPPGMTVLDERPFDCPRPAQCESAWNYSETYANALTIVQDPTAPKSAPNVAQQIFTPALPGGSSPAITERAFPGAGKTTLYVATWMKLSSNFVGHPTGTNKMVHFVINGSNRLFLQARGIGAGALVPSFGLQGLAAPYFDGVSQTATAVNLLPNVGNAAINRGQWQRYEIVLVGNTPGIANGSAQLWIDGVRVLNYSGIMFAAPGGSGKWDAVQWSPTWGGGGGIITVPFTMSMDHMYISGK